MSCGDTPRRYPLDRPLDPGVQRAARRRRALSLGLALAALAWLLVAAPGWVRPQVERNRIRTAVVERGALEATLTASGTVVPEREHIVSSPIETRVLHVLKTPGAVVTRGEPIVELDVNQSRLALERLEEQIALKRNEADSERIATQQSSLDLERGIEIKKLEIESFEIARDRQQKLFDKGVVSENDLRAADVELKRSRIELRQLEETLRWTREASAVRLEKLELERRIQEKERDQARRELELATACSSHDGVLTWAVQSEGAAVRAGDVIARVADLSTFRVEARISDVHGPSLQPGLPARVQLGDEILDGTIRRVLPEVDNGTLTVLVGLSDSAHPALRPNLRVDVHLVTARKDTTLRVKRGPYVHAGDGDAVFVVRGESAVRTPVEFGIASFDHHEVLAGLVEGDEVIISDMSDHRRVKEVRIK